jgi:hypothetical protein
MLLKMKNSIFFRFPSAQKTVVGMERRDNHEKQGDQIGLIFAHWVIVYFGYSFENLKSSPYFWATTFSMVKVNHRLKQLAWATFWAIFHKPIWSPCSFAQSRRT